MAAIDLRVYSAPYNPDNPTANLIDQRTNITLDVSTQGYTEADPVTNYGNAFWNNQAGGEWRVCTCTKFIELNAFIKYVMGQLNLATAWWNENAAVFFEVGDDPTDPFYALYNSTYNIIHNAQKSAQDMWEGRGTAGGTGANYQKGTGIQEYISNPDVTPPVVSLYPPAVLALDPRTVTIAAGSDGNAAISSSSGGTLNVPPRYMEGSYDGAQNSSDTDTWGRRFPSDVTAIIIAPLS